MVLVPAGWLTIRCIHPCSQRDQARKQVHTRAPQFPPNHGVLESQRRRVVQGATDHPRDHNLSPHPCRHKAHCCCRLKVGKVCSRPLENERERSAREDSDSLSHIFFVQFLGRGCARGNDRKDPSQDTRWLAMDYKDKHYVA